MSRLDTHSTAERRIIDFRPLHIRGALVLGRYQYNKAHPAVPLHQHDHSIEICYLARGEQIYRVGQEDFHVRGGDVFLTFPNEPHSTGRTPEQRGDLYWLLVNMSPDRRGFLGCELAEGRRLRQSLLAIRPRHFKGSPALKTLLVDVFTTVENTDFAFRKTGLVISLVRFLLEVLECNRCSRKPTGPSPEILASRYHPRGFLRRTRAQPAASEDLAAAAG